MGAINYGTTFKNDRRGAFALGYNCNAFYDYEQNSADFEDFADFDDFYNYMCDCCAEDAEQIEQKIPRLDFFKIELVNGYYEGYYLRIESEYNYYNDSTEKAQALKELTIIKQFLFDCVNEGLLTGVSVGWCTGYYDRTETLKRIADFIRREKLIVKALPTDRTAGKFAPFTQLWSYCDSVCDKVYAA